MVRRPRTPPWRLLLPLLWTWICCSSVGFHFTLAVIRSRRPPLLPSLKDISSHYRRTHRDNSYNPFLLPLTKKYTNTSYFRAMGQCPNNKEELMPLSDLRTMIDRAMVLPSPTSPPAHQTCLPANYRCQAGDPCVQGGLCLPELTENRLLWSRRLYLEHCPHLTFFSVMSKQDREDLSDRTKCCDLGRHLLERNQVVYRILLQHETLLKRSNFEDHCNIGQGLFNMDMCGSTPEGGCVTCKEAYRRWVCAQLFVFYDGNGCPVRPCPNICHCVEQKCPYFLPQEKPVAGEPSFLCEDPSVGNLEPIHSSSRCYEPCPHNASLGRLNEKRNSDDFALCIHENRNCNCPSRSSRRRQSSQCLSSPGTDCNCDTSRGASVNSISVPYSYVEAWTHSPHLWALLLSILRTRVIQLPRGFT